MEIANLLTWFIVVAAVVGLGGGTMIWAYAGSGSKAIIFEDPVPAPSAYPKCDDQSKLQNLFSQGYTAFTAGKHRQAIAQFNQAIEVAPRFAEAYHNRGLAYANLRQDNDAATDLARASELYATEDNQEGISEVKQDLQLLKVSRQN